jgi:hypothetical protein
VGYNKLRIGGASPKYRVCELQPNNVSYPYFWRRKCHVNV